MMMTGRSGTRSLTCFSRSRPDCPGMRMSDTITLGGSPSASAASASSADSKLRLGMSSRPSAFSSTQRMERSSSMIQTGLFMIRSCCPFVIGSRMVKQVRPGLDSTSMLPWCCWMKLCASVRPRPLPPSRPETSG